MHVIKDIRAKLPAITMDEFERMHREMQKDHRSPEQRKVTARRTFTRMRAHHALHTQADCGFSSFCREAFTAMLRQIHDDGQFENWADLTLSNIDDADLPEVLDEMHRIFWKATRRVLGNGKNNES